MEISVQGTFENETNDYAGDGEPQSKALRKATKAIPIRRTISKLNLQKVEFKNLLT